MKKKTNDEKMMKRMRRFGREPIPKDTAEMMAMIDAHIEEQMRLTPPNMKLLVNIRTTKEGVVVDFDRVVK
jgi:hypothetical protein